jgi:glucose/arabinose dehydrogenase
MTQTSVLKSFARFFAFVSTLIALSVHGASVPAGFIDVIFASGLTNPTAMAIAPDGRIFVCEQTNRVRIVENGAVLPNPFASVVANTGSRDRGLCGIALDPDFNSNGFVYINYTASSGGSVLQRISRFTASGNVAVPGSETVLFETDLFTAIAELGGGLRFGPDATLYIGAGMSGPSANSQSMANVLGKLLRINKDGSIPTNNPFFGTATGKNRAIWALGLRNPFSFAFQRGTGRLFINDVGQGSREEINEGVAGANYGWAICEGACNPSNSNFRDPLSAYAHINGQVAITGGAFYDPVAPLFPTQYVGKYFFTDYNAGWINQLDPATTNVATFATGLPTSTVDLQVGPDGGLYYLSRNGALGAQGGAFVGKIAYLPTVTTLVSTGAVWKYLDTGATNLGASWIQPAFDDSAWSNGVAQLGWGPNGEATLVRSNRSDGTRITTTYFRKSFAVSNTAPYSNLVVRLVRDDGGVVYLNGTEVFRNNMPAGAVNPSTLALVVIGGADERLPYGALVNASLLLNGTNVIAVEIHQQAITGVTDMSFDLSLLGVSGVAALRAVLSGGGLTLAYPSWATGFTLEAATNVPSAVWTVVPTNGASVIGNEVQLPVSMGEPQQFFRLRSP